MPTISQLRQQCRQARRELSPLEQKTHALQASRLLLSQACLKRPKKIALFLAQDGELDPSPLIDPLRQRGHQLYLPVLKTLRGRGPKGMAFAPFNSDNSENRWQTNHFGIAEPHTPQQMHRVAQQMDLILMPLTCFDRQKNRIGMGGGFYDRALSFKKYFPQLKPKLIGWSHHCQQVHQIDRQPWDIPLDLLVTEQGIW